MSFSVKSIARPEVMYPRQSYLKRKNKKYTISYKKMGFDLNSNKFLKTEVLFREYFI